MFAIKMRAFRASQTGLRLSPLLQNHLSVISQKIAILKYADRPTNPESPQENQMWKNEGTYSNSGRDAVARAS
ncbi:hypothetical protein [Microcoleus sp. herbarium14]|uniref:hypothetical protein n=1 Tax=Microcoleus sp. herbarium14 TaxID=3055439 RepID=UPI002FD7669D